MLCKRILVLALFAIPSLGYGMGSGVDFFAEYNAGTPSLSDESLENLSPETAVLVHKHPIQQYREHLRGYFQVRAESKAINGKLFWLDARGVDYKQSEDLQKRIFWYSQAFTKFHNQLNAEGPNPLSAALIRGGQADAQLRQAIKQGYPTQEIDALQYNADKWFDLATTQYDKQFPSVSGSTE